MINTRPATPTCGVAPVLSAVSARLQAACAAHRPMHSSHEALAVIQEELDEYKQQVYAWPKRHDPAQMQDELLDVAAMAIRAILDLHTMEACS